MTITEKWAAELVTAEIMTGKRYAVGDRLTEYDGREHTRDVVARADGGGWMLRGEVGGDHRTLRVAWTWVTDEIRARADEVRPEVDRYLAKHGD